MKTPPASTHTPSAKRTAIGPLVVAIVFILLLGACASQPKDQILLMPAPDIYDSGNLDPFTDSNPVEDIPYGGILYATDREPAEAPGQHYEDARGHVLRLGVARITAGLESMTWEEARRITLLKNRPKDYPLKVSHVEEIGILDRSISVFTESSVDRAAARAAGAAFVRKINAKLAVSKRKDIYIYVHGYKVVFENPLLVASELWHFLGYEGVFIAYAWPSTPDRWAYASDLETASLSAGNLRILLAYLADNTTARRIHIIGYSAGTRLVAQALHQLSLMHTGYTLAGKTKDLRIGHVILTGSDIDRELFGAFLEDGMTRIVNRLTIYTSRKDKALGASRWLFRRDRLGQMWSRNPPPEAIDYLRRNNAVTIINVTEAEGAGSGNGHAYFRRSPWTSSDILATLAFDLRPVDRGLVSVNNLPIWTFPPDYIQRLRRALMKVQPEMFSK
jgi:esterase/lipase superfamily enzyme